MGHWWAGVKVPLRLGPEVLEPRIASTETKITSLCNENKGASLLGLGPHEFNPCCISDCPAVITVGKMGPGFTRLSQGHPKTSNEAGRWEGTRLLLVGKERFVFNISQKQNKTKP